MPNAGIPISFPYLKGPKIKLTAGCPAAIHIQMKNKSGGNSMKKLLIVYYSWSNGNTERIAKKLQSIAGGDLLKIDTAVPYSGSYDGSGPAGSESGL